MAADRLTLAGELHARGVAEENLGHPLRARRLLERARVTLLDGRSADVREPGRAVAVDVLDTAIAISLALTDAELRGIDSALPALEEAGRRATALGDPGLLVRVHSQRAFIAIRTGRYAVARDELAEANRLIAHANENDTFAILLNDGMVRLLLSDLAGARRSLTRAAEYAERIGMPVGQFKALHNLGYLEFLAGDLPRALELMDRAGGLGADVSLGIWHLDRARVLAEAGLVRDADESLASAGQILHRDRMAQDLAETELERAACALMSGDPRAARLLAGHARDRFRRRGNERWLRRAELVLLQADLADGRPGRRLAPHAERVHAELRAAGAEQDARTAALVHAEALLAAGSVIEAGAAARGTGGPTKGDPITTRLHARYVAARLGEADGDRAGAARTVATALSELARYQAGFGCVDLQTASAVHGRRLAELGVRLALRDGRVAAVFAAAERARAVSSRMPAVRPPVDPDDARLLAELRQTVDSLRSAALDPDAAAKLQRRRVDLERAVRARRWSLAGAGSARRTARLAEVRSALAEADTALAMFVQNGDALHVVLLRPRGAEVLPLGPAALVIECIRRLRADLDVLAAAHLPRAVGAAAQNSQARTLDLLDRILLGPLRLGSGQRLAVVSTGTLGQLPWGLLPSLRGVPVVVAPSATAWLGAQLRPAGRRRHVVALAGPELLRAADEVGAVVRAWGRERARGVARAGRDDLTAALGRAGVVHVAAHGWHNAQNPLFSLLRMTDGPLFAHELDQTRAAPAHVVLSACDLGLATVRPGDEPLGLASVLLRMGTPSVVAGVARVGDEPALHAMRQYHRALAAGAPSADALAAVTERTAIPMVNFGASWRPPKPARAPRPTTAR